MVYYSYFYPQYNRGYYNGTVGFYATKTSSKPYYIHYNKGSDFYEFGRRFYTKRNYWLPDEIIHGLSEYSRGRKDSDVVIHSDYFDVLGYIPNYDDGNPYKGNNQSKQWLKAFRVDDALEYISAYDSFLPVKFDPYKEKFGDSQRNLWNLGVVKKKPRVVYEKEYYSGQHDYLSLHIYKKNRGPSGREWLTKHFDNKLKARKYPSTTYEFTKDGLRAYEDYFSDFTKNYIADASRDNRGAMVLIKNGRPEYHNLKGAYTLVNDTGLDGNKLLGMMAYGARMRFYNFLKDEYNISGSRITNFPTFDIMEPKNAAEYLKNKEEEKGKGFTGEKLYFSPVTTARNLRYFFRTPSYQRFLKNKNL